MVSDSSGGDVFGGCGLETHLELVGILPHLPARVIGILDLLMLSTGWVSFECVRSED
jgi:hypothetical protein